MSRRSPGGRRSPSGAPNPGKGGGAGSDGGHQLFITPALLQRVTGADNPRKLRAVGELDLQYQSEKRAKIKVIEGLDGMGSLTKLNLSGNGITYQGILPVIKTLMHSNTVVNLDLSDNPLGDHGVMALSCWTRASCSLQTLKLNDVAMTEASGYQLVHFGQLDIEANGHDFSPAVVRRIDAGTAYVECDRPCDAYWNQCFCSACFQLFDDYVACECRQCIPEAGEHFTPGLERISPLEFPTELPPCDDVCAQRAGLLQLQSQ